MLFLRGAYDVGWAGGSAPGFNRGRVLLLFSFLILLFLFLLPLLLLLLSDRFLIHFS